jgi:hypothetical protein
MCFYPKDIAVVFRVSMMLIGIALSVPACSTTKSIQKSTVSPFKITHTAISKDIKEVGNLSRPIDLAQEFTTQDEEVVSYLAFQHLTGKHQLRWDWYRPDGKLYRTTGNYTLKTHTDTYVAEGSACHKLPLKNTKAADYPGNWKVEIFLDNALTGTDTFSVRQIKEKNPLVDLSKINFGNSDHSVFAAALIEALGQNEDVMDTTELFSKIRRPVMLNADQTPEYSDIRKAGYEGGDFLFVPTQKEK